MDMPGAVTVATGDSRVVLKVQTMSADGNTFWCFERKTKLVGESKRCVATLIPWVVKRDEVLAFHEKADF